MSPFLADKSDLIPDLQSMRHLLSITFAALSFALSSYAGEPAKPPCTETVVIDSVRYPVPARWCGQKIDSSLWAGQTDLAPLPPELSFEDLRIFVTRATRDAFAEMAAAAKKDSVILQADSGYRSPRYQREIIRRRLARGDSIDKIFLSASPPGYSEHHTGRALDLVPSEARFASTRAYTWLKKNAARFGFHETYPKDGGSGLPWESWHWCYRGDK